MRVEDLLRDSARRRPGKTALVTGKRRLTFAELDVMSDRLAAALTRRGIARDDRLAVFMENSFEAVVAIFAVLKAGAVFTLVAPSTKADKLSFVLTSCCVAGIITEARLAGTAGAAVARSETIRLVVLAGGGSAPLTSGCLSFEAAIATTANPATAAGGELDPAMIACTSRATGVVKNRATTHHSIIAAVSAIATRLESSEHDVVLGLMPLFLDYGFYQAITALKVGATLVLEPSFTSPEAALARIAEEKVTGLPLVPEMLAAIVQLKNSRPDRFRHLRYISNTAPSLPPVQIARLRELFPSARVHSLYGLAESTRPLHLPPPGSESRPNSVGIATPCGDDAWVELDDGGERIREIVRPSVASAALTRAELQEAQP